MPELPDIVIYTEALARRPAGQPLTGIRLLSPFLLRTALPPIENTYCARCQTGGVVLADRALSRLLKKSWPRSIDELE